MEIHIEHVSNSSQSWMTELRAPFGTSWRLIRTIVFPPHLEDRSKTKAVLLFHNANDSHDDHQGSVDSHTNNPIVHHAVVWKVAHFIVKFCEKDLVSMNSHKLSQCNPRCQELPSSGRNEYSQMDIGHCYYPVGIMGIHQDSPKNTE